MTAARRKKDEVGLVQLDVLLHGRTAAEPGWGTAIDGRSASEGSSSRVSHATCEELRLNTLFSRRMLPMVGK